MSTEGGTAAPAPPDSSRATWRAIGQSAGVRVLVLPVSAVLGIVNTRLIISNFGEAAYAQYGLLVTIGTLLPFADLGMGAAIMNTVGAADDASTDPRVRRVLITSFRVLAGSAAVILTVSALISAAGWWPGILGEALLPGSGPVAAAWVLAVIAFTLPVAVGQRVLTGLGRNHLVVGLNGLQTPIVLAGLLVVIGAGWEIGGYLPILPYVVTFGLTAAALGLASRMVRPAIGATVRQVPRVRSVRGERVFDVAWPMLVQMIALPIAMQSDRLVLSHAAGTEELATYNLAAQMYLPVWQVVSAAGVTLWPIFARARAQGEQRDHSPVPIAVRFGAAAVVVCTLITLAAPWLAEVASDGAVEIPLGVRLVFAVFMVLQATKYPLGMFMTDARGLRFQALMILVMVPVNLGLSLALAGPLGAAGPVVGSVVGVLLFQVVANWWFVRRAMAPEPSP